MALNQPSTLPAKDTEKLGLPGQLDVVILLVRDHRAVQQALNDYQRAKDPERRQELIRHVMAELKTHEAAEEKAFWPAIRRELPGGEKLAAARRQEEDEAKRTIAELEAMNPREPAWDGKVQAFIGAVLNHASREEREVFLPARETLSVDRLMALGRDLEQAKKKR
jgi:hemerythrin superfamily protein